MCKSLLYYLLYISTYHSVLSVKCILGLFVFPNSDIDYRVFNVHTCSFLCMRIHTWVGLGKPTASRHNITKCDHRQDSLAMTKLTQLSFLSFFAVIHLNPLSKLYGVGHGKVGGGEGGTRLFGKKISIIQRNAYIISTLEYWLWLAFREFILE